MSVGLSQTSERFFSDKTRESIKAFLPVAVGKEGGREGNCRNGRREGRCKGEGGKRRGLQEGADHLFVKKQRLRDTHLSNTHHELFKQGYEGPIIPP